MSAVTDVVSDVAGGAVDAVGSTVEGVADVVQTVAEPVVQAVDNTIQAAVNDPIGTAAMITTAIVAPAMLPYVSAANAAANGASLEQIATSAALSAAGAQAGLEAGSFAPTEYAPYVQQAATGATNAALRGGDVTQGALTNLINSQGNSALRGAINGPSTSGGAYDGGDQDQSEQLPAQPDSMKYTPLSSLDMEPVNYGLQGSTPGLKADFDPSNVFNPDGTINYDLNPSNDGGIGLMPSESPNIKKMNGAQGLTGFDGNGTYSALGYTPFDSSPNLGDPNSFINNPEVLGRDVAMTDTSNNFYVPKVNFAGALGLGSQSSSGGNGTPTQKQNEQYGSPKLLKGNGLEGDSTGDPYYLQHLRQLYASLTPNMGQDMGQDVATFADGGSATSSSKNTDNPFDPFPTAVTGIARGPLMGGGQRRVATITPLQQLRTGLTSRMAKGGIAEKYASATPKGHKPEFITGLTGYYAQGKGTGQSDDIDAMLHDGDYVADADLVAALGDGSSKAGAEALEKFRRQVPHKEHAVGGSVVPAKIADGEYVFPASFVTAIGQGDNKNGAKILDKMREAIREHKRSAPTTKIPPKAKSPLEYLKMVKG